MNIGNPNEFTLLELAETVIEVTGSRSEIVHEALPTDDPKIRQPDITRASCWAGSRRSSCARACSAPSRRWASRPWSAPAPEVGRLRRHAVLTRAALLVFNALQGSKLMPGLLRWGLSLHLWGIRSASRRISDGCWFGGRDITIGRRTFVNFGCVFDNLGPIRVGDDCDLGMEVLIATSTHEVAGAERRAGALSGRPVEIGDGCWIGARAILLPGVTVCYRCIVGAGAVVTRDCEPNGLYAGNPARRLRELI